jgi:predicted transcriptional regulator
MRAKAEYDKWCALERAWEESRFGVMQEKAYVTGFNRAIQLMEKFLREKEYENITKITSSRPNTEGKETTFGNRH